MNTNCTYVIMLFACLMLTSSCTKDKLQGTDFKYNSETTIIKWTAYKYTERFGINGSFDKFEINSTGQSSNPKDLLKNASFKIYTQSINTNSSLRDHNIYNYFFKQLQNYKTIKGEVIGIDGNIKKGKLQVDIQLNSITNIVEFEYKIKDNFIKLEADLDLSDWQAISAIDNMEKCCVDYHTGSDGVHIVWPDVKIELSTRMSELFN